MKHLTLILSLFSFGLLNNITFAMEVQKPFVLHQKIGKNALLKLMGPLHCRDSLMEPKISGWSPNEKYLALKNKNNGHILIKNIQERDYTLALHGKDFDLDCMAVTSNDSWSNDGNYLALRHFNKPIIKILDLISKKITTHNNVWDSTFSPNSEYLALKSKDHMLKIYDLSQNKLMQTYNNIIKKGTLFEYQWFPFNEVDRIIIQYNDKTCKIHNPISGKAVKTIKNVASFKNSPYKKYLLIQKINKKLKVLNRNFEKQIPTIHNVDVIDLIPFDNDKCIKVVYNTPEYDTEVIDLNNGDKKMKVTGQYRFWINTASNKAFIKKPKSKLKLVHNNRSTKLPFDSDSNTYFSPSDKYALIRQEKKPTWNILDLTSKKIVMNAENDNSACKEYEYVQWLDNTDYLLMLNTNHQLKIVDLVSKNIMNLTKNVFAFSTSPKGNFIAVAKMDGKIEIWQRQNLISSIKN